MKKQSPWLLGGVGLVVALGFASLLMGLFIPGQLVLSELAASSDPTPWQKLKKRSESQALARSELIRAVTQNSEGDRGHRIFVSRPLVYLPKETETVQPINDQQVTEDGIQIGWKLKNQFDPEDPTIAAEDSDRDGFTNKEEYDKGTDPRDAANSPARWVKIKIASVETNTLVLGFSGKSANRFTLRFQLAGKKKDIDVTAGDPLWIAATPKGLEILKSESEVARLRETGACPHSVPILVKAYHEDKGRRLDEKTKTENDYDDSYLEVERTDGKGSLLKIMLDERGKSRGVVWEVGDIRLLSLVPGEGEMGPFRVGQSFDYAGKQFVILSATGNKVVLWMKPDGEEVLILPKTP